MTEITLSTTEAEYTGLSHALREAIPLLRTINEMKLYDINVITGTCPIRCRVHEDNAGAIEIARTSKYRPRTKHLNIKLHHFRSYINDKSIEVVKIAGTKQPADILTKPVGNPLFALLRKHIMGW